MPIICRFHICKFIYLLKFVSNSKSNIHGTFSHLWACAAQQSESPSALLLSCRRIRRRQFPRLGSYTVNRSSFHCLLCCVFHVFVFSRVILVLKMAPGAVMECSLVRLSARTLPYVDRAGVRGASFRKESQRCWPRGQRRRINSMC